MIPTLVILSILSSFICSFVLNKQHIAVLLVLMASCRVARTIDTEVAIVFFAALLHFFNTFFTTKQNKSFLWILLLPLTFISFIFLTQPYEINFINYLGYLAALFIFAWVMLLKWDSKTIIRFLTTYGSFLLLTGFLEKALTNNMRIGLVLTVATAYAVVLVIAWTIWTTAIFLSKTHSKKIILSGTFLVFLAVVLSGARMGLVGIVLGLALCSLFAFIIKKQTINIIKISLYSLCIFVVLAFLSFLVWNLLPDDLAIKKSFSYLVAGKLDSSNMGRLLMWLASIDTFEQNKFFGIGAGNFPQKLKVFLESKNILKSISINENIHSHNIFLMVLTEHGIIGFLVLGTFIFFCLSRSFLYFLKNKRSFEIPALFAGCIVMAVLGMVDSIPMYLPTSGFAAWVFGTMSSYGG